MTLSFLPPYVVVGIIWLPVIFLVLLMMIPRADRRKAILTIIALSAIFAMIATVLFILSPDAPRISDSLNKVINKLLGG